VLLRWTGAETPDAVRSACHALGPVLLQAGRAADGAVEKAWQLRVRSHFERRGFMRVGSDRYVRLKDIHGDGGVFKSGFRVQASLSAGHPAVFVDPRSRVMEPIGLQDVLEAEEMRGDSDLRLRLL